jgi:hypothetical protein
MTVLMRQTWQLVAPLARAVPWAPLAGTAVLTFVIAGIARFDASGSLSADAAVTLLRLAAIALGAGAAFAPVDPMGALPVPAPRWLRQWLRVVLIAVPAAGLWYADAVYLRAPVTGGLVAEALVCALVGVAGAAFASRHRHTLSAALAGPVTQVGLLAATFFVSGRQSPWAWPGEPRWDAVHRWWWAAAAVVTVALLLANREPGPVIGRGSRRSRTRR